MPKGVVPKKHRKPEELLRTEQLNTAVTPKVAEGIKILAAINQITPNHELFLIAQKYVCDHQAQIQYYKDCTARLADEIASVSRQSIRVHSTTEEE